MSAKKESQRLTINMGTLVRKDPHDDVNGYDNLPALE